MLHALGVFAGRPRSALIIVSDDLRPELGTYGGLAKTPNLDALALSAGATQFDRAYVQVALCGPSRAPIVLPATACSSINRLG